MAAVRKWWDTRVKEGNRPAGYWGALWLSLLLTVPAALRLLPMWQARYGGPPSWQTTDIDTGLIHDGLVQAPHFVDTLQWWVGRWVGEVPFYRPLTSYVFWIEWKLFGDQEWWYAIPTFGAHVLATLLAAALAYRLAERWRVAWPALVAVSMAAIFTGITRDYRMNVVAMVAGQWKNQPDSLAASFCFLSLLAYLRGQDRGRAWPGAATAYYLAACCFKEIAVPLPLVCAALELAGPREGGWRRSLTRAGLVAVSGACFLAVRQWAIEGTGYTYGSNTRWFDRTLLELLGPLSSAIPGGLWLGCVAGFYACALGVLWWRARPWWTARKWGGTMAAISTLLLFTAGASVLAIFFERPESAEYWRNSSWGVQFAQSLLIYQNPTHSSSVSGVIYMVAAAWALWKRSRPALWIAPLWTLAFLAPLMMSPGPSHRYYLPQFGYALFDALGCAALLAAVSPTVISWWRSRRAGETSGKSAASAIQ